MTRINLIPPVELCRQHLVAEYRELPRIFPRAYAAYMRGESPNDPRNPIVYVLGIGHVRFFYPRLMWLNKRFMSLIAEMKIRNYTVNYPEPYDLSKFPRNWCNDWIPSSTEIMVNRARIEERLRNMNIQGLL